jgi:hypothetical protein
MLMAAVVVPITIPHLWKMSMCHGLKISTEFAGSEPPISP